MANVKATVKGGLKKFAKYLFKKLRFPVVLLLAGYVGWNMYQSTVEENLRLKEDLARISQERDDAKSTVKSQTRVQERRRERSTGDSSSAPSKQPETRKSAPDQAPSQSPRERQLQRERDRTEAGKERDRRLEEFQKKWDAIENGNGAGSTLSPREEPPSIESLMPERMREFRRSRGSRGSRSSSRRGSTRTPTWSVSGLVPTSDKWLKCGDLPPGQTSKNDLVTILSKPGNGYVLVVAGSQLPSIVMETGANKAVILDDGKHMVLPLIPDGGECYLTPRPGGYPVITLVQFTGSPATGLRMNGVREISGLWSGADVRGRRFDANVVWPTAASKRAMTQWLSQYANPNQPG